MASKYSEIRPILEARLNSTVGIPAIAWENVDYKPTTDTPFIKFQFIPTSRRPSTLGVTPNNRTQGIVRLLVHNPENVGPGASEDVADTLVDRFEANTDLTDGTNFIRIEYAQRESSYINQPWYITPVTIGWYCYE